MNNKFDQLINVLLKENVNNFQINKIFQQLPHLDTDDLDHILGMLVEDDVYETLYSRKDRISKIKEIIPQLDEDEIDYIYNMLFEDDEEEESTPFKKPSSWKTSYDPKTKKTTYFINDKEVSKSEYIKRVGSKYL